MSSSSSHVKIGVFIPNGAQFLDVACVDSLGTMDKAYLDAIPFVPAAVSSLAPDVSVYYISSPAQGPDIPLTSGAVVRATHVYTDEDVAPGRLDVVVVPGPDPAEKFADEGLAWLRRHSETEGVDVLSICTGLFVCAAAGIADGRRASGPKELQRQLRASFPGLRLVGDKYRWVRDGSFWSSGGVTNGNDLVAAYARDSGRWARPVVEAGLGITEVGDRGQFY
ncbi:ThiJ/PfpI family protein [Metarhizium album ARSEF 1941]|uniref:ThiJ/PfpI family protein n=1 Tax=Metarhizium album (strain ARSEF 1941) TaxID=1081103 RepID=A0A0B2WNW4_METAS|nr:ThiJ/PfpI family protein [Metarhizium album ARSEF 1941]KHN95329.1 ThiJ/PfpI family protein [Metarhizium album ARSEF 1941]